MNLNYIIFIFHITFVRIANVQCGKENVCPTNSDQSLPLDDLKISLSVSNDETEYSHLKKINRVLANENLPIWTIQPNSPIDSMYTKRIGKLTLNHEVMKNLGKFTFYHDVETSSSAVYFHQRREFDGLIDYRHVIRELPIEKIHINGKTRITLNTCRINSRTLPNDHLTQLTIEEEITDESRTVYDEIRKTYRNKVYEGYPEILVIISRELTIRILENALLTENERELDDYGSIVSYILTLFNGADMLYSKLQMTNIKLNIAGIIFPTHCKAFSFLEECYRKINPESKRTLEGECTIRKIQEFVFSHRDSLHRDSYDVVVYLNKDEFLGHQNTELAGYAEINNIFQEKVKNKFMISTVIVKDDGNFRGYVTFAHELAHLMKLEHDIPLLINKDECNQNIMRAEGTFCKKCLVWSETSELEFKKFFSSADCCSFINKPRSLYPPGKRLTLTADEQCQCYGYQQTLTFPEYIDNYCKENLLCQNDNDRIHTVLIPVDGTPCAVNKVCWNGKCKNIE